MGLQTFVDDWENIKVPNHWAIEPAAAHAFSWREKAGVRKRSKQDINQVSIKVGRKIVLVLSRKNISDANVYKSIHRADIGKFMCQKGFQKSVVVQTTF